MISASVVVPHALPCCLKNGIVSTLGRVVSPLGVTAGAAVPVEGAASVLMFQAGIWPAFGAFVTVDLRKAGWKRTAGWYNAVLTLRSSLLSTASSGGVTTCSPTKSSMRFI